MHWIKKNVKKTKNNRPYVSIHHFWNDGLKKLFVLYILDLERNAKSNSRCAFQ